jgi:hypothetical protein
METLQGTPQTPLQAAFRSGHQALASPGWARPRIPGRARDGWLRGQRWTWIGSGVWPVRPSLTSNVITARSSADLKRPPLGVVLDLPFVAADCAEQVSHGSPTSASVWTALTLHGSGSLDVFTFDKPRCPGLGHQGSRRSSGYRRRALCCASRTAALATMAVILLAVFGNAVGDATDAAVGQWMRTAAGSLSGSLKTIRSSSVGLMSPRAVLVWALGSRFRVKWDSCPGLVFASPAGALNFTLGVSRANC